MYSLFHNTDEKDDNKMEISIGIRVLTKVLAFFYLLYFLKTIYQKQLFCYAKITQAMIWPLLVRQ